MQALRKHIIYKVLAFTLACAILIPTAVKFSHAFNHYKHEICFGEKTAHLHKLDLDCRFYDFKLTQTYYVSHFTFETFTPTQAYIRIIAPYFFLSDYQKLHFSLRGPPSLV